MASMTDRSRYLARTLLSRMRSLEIALLDDAAPDEAESSLRRQELVAQVLLIEESITDGVMCQLVTAALPRVFPEQASTEREIAELADFLDAQLKTSL